MQEAKIIRVAILHDYTAELIFILLTSALADVLERQPPVPAFHHRDSARDHVTLLQTGQRRVIEISVPLHTLLFTVVAT